MKRPIDANVVPTLRELQLARLRNLARRILWALLPRNPRPRPPIVH